MIWIIVGGFALAFVFGAWQRYERARRARAADPPDPK
jgi:hypothetical protein